MGSRRFVRTYWDIGLNDDLLTASLALWHLSPSSLSVANRLGQGAEDEDLHCCWDGKMSYREIPSMRSHSHATV